MGVMKTLTINGTTYSVVPIVPALSVTLLANEWVKEGDTYSQVVGVEGVTSHSKVDLQPTPEQLEEFHYKVLAFVAENDGGKVTVYAVGDKPDGDHTIQVTLTEVEGTGKIRGNTVGTTMPRANLEQEDSQQADYVEGKEAFLQKIADRGLSNALTINGKTYDGSEAVTVDTTPFVITVTGDDTAGYTADKTISELTAAYAANRPMVCNIDGGASRIPLVQVTGATTIARVYFFQGFNGTAYRRVALNVAGQKLTVTVSNGDIGGLKPLTINGTAYDGTKAVTVNTSPLYITMTQDESTGEFAADHSFFEALNAYSTGRTPVCVFEGFLIPLIGYGPEGFTFSTILYLEGFMVSVTFMLGSDGTVVFEDQMIETGEFVVTVTGNADNGYTSDKTYEEVLAAHEAGRNVACLFNGEMFSGFRIPLAMVEGGLLLFLFMPMPGAGVVVNLMDGAVEASEMLLDVTIGGQTWQMDEPVDFTDTINGMIDEKIDKIPSGDSIPDYVRTEAERLSSVVQARQNENTVSAILSSDYHLPQPSHAYYAQILESITHAGQAMSILRSRLSLDFEAKLGDLIWDATETPAEALKSFQVVHSLASEGNVLDRYEGNGNHDHLQSNDAPLTDAQVYANIGIYNKGCVRDDANRVGGYCYKDYDEFMLRVVLLNTSEANDGSFAMSSKQIEWMSEALNVPVEEGWGILILSHHPLDWGGSSTAVMKKIKAASGIIANLHGHVHTFTQDVITGTEIPRLAIPNVCFYRNNEYGQNGKAENSEGIEFGTTTTYSKTPKSATDTSFCVLTLDRATGKLYLDRYGAGIDREETVPTWGKLGYTNLVPTSEAADSTEPYNADGYKNGVYLSSNGGDSEDETCVATGYIPYTWATQNSIYVKGAEVSSASHVRIYGYSAKGSAPVGSATCSGPNLSTYFTVEELGANYYRLTPLSSNATGVVYLRLSLIGTGENLIVTVNEPIE
jgi:hypothetical protein